MRKRKLNLSTAYDWIHTENIDRKRFSKPWTDKSSSLDNDLLKSSQFYVFYLAAFLITLLFLARLFMLTVVEGQKNRTLAENNRIRLVEVEAPRGKILDRNGNILADSEKVYFLEKDGKLQQIISDQAKELQKLGLANENFSGELGKISVEIARRYPLSVDAAHVLGYTSVVQGDEVKKGQSKVQAVGRLGLEQNYNDFLTGKPGGKLIEVDARERKVSILGERAAVGGRNIYSTIDLPLQKIAYELLAQHTQSVGTKKGAVVAQNPQTGEILALASSPSFDPEDIGKSVSDLEKPFFNRATQGSYPPGSIFKIVTALAGLDSGLIDENTQIEDVGEFELGSSKFSNWFFNQYGKRDGVLKIQKAIARSNDIFFYRVAEKVGLETLRRMAIKLGFGQKTGIDLPAEAVGLVPDEVWKKSAYGQDWFLGDTMHMGIGQGFLLATPIQINMATSYMASGKLMKPYLVSKIDGESGSAVNLGSKVLGQDLVSRANFDLVRSGMRDACRVGGTGAPFFNAPYEVGCKTGTAEKTLGNPHAWFTVFAPFDKPTIAVTILIEDGGEGSVVAAPVAREIINWWIINRNK
ncbi:hypothetical protein A2696_01925 [Candidatus Curtissbacteria bacterium RIFCSPHIGHO2_01_FULL_41_13]|uniref:Penicillin-binding protein 2 n=1 Tax=Candidatus Curtissbacteria bacterium RIFCSPHIGHO2_01_FULL_41_13 TaxID=1797745 RepID=A0A1F5FYB2_9BACT|nr:MAG: hypothetical protein A2696_01925 [Candidatus Curtissbacteria bacterium RIFCSPHIGHO2_01_FULL_41_13]